MEAAKLKKTKGTISKGKIKKTIKNVICRPDASFWPVTSESEMSAIDNILKNYRVNIPNFKKPHWNEIKSLKKDERPRPPPIRKVDGLLFGISECHDAIQNKKCSAVIIESLVNPQSIVQPVIDVCVIMNTPVVCMENLRNMCKGYFGIQTSCLGIKTGSMLDLSNKLEKISCNNKPKLKIIPKETMDSENTKCIKNDVPMEVENIKYSPYLYRTNKKNRVFVPSNKVEEKDKNQFIGQHFIKLSEQNEIKKDSKAYMRMMLKKISSNPNRVQLKKNNCIFF